MLYNANGLFSSPGTTFGAPTQQNKVQRSEQTITFSRDF
jgi:hypothetical protein